MGAITRWNSYGIDAQGVATDGRSQACKGTRGYSIGYASVGDSFTIGPTTNKLYLTIDGESLPYITLYSGADLDPRYVARDITEKMHAAGKSDQRWDNAICRWENVHNGSMDGNRFKIYSGTLGSSASVAVGTGGAESADVVLGFDTATEVGGSATSNTFNGGITISGTYYGFLDEVYHVVISNDNDASRGIDTPGKSGSNTYNGTMTTGGVFNHASDILYTINIDVTNGTTMGAGTGNVPTIAWTSTGSVDDSNNSVELLYPNFWYTIGTKGLMVKFTDAVFNQCSAAWTVQCYTPDYAQGTNASAPVGTAEYVWSSDRGDGSASPIATISGTATRLGTRGITISFTQGGTNLEAGDEFFVICSAPKPSNYNITSINYGNVTVSTESDVKCVMFEIESGAVEMSTVKVGLNSHGSFSHHNAGNSDTYFRFGTVGVGSNAGSGNTNGIEWYPNIVAGDIDSDTPPNYLYATKANLSVVATADDSETVGNSGLVADLMWMNIHLGTAETGANSSIVVRSYFDYS